MFLRQKCLSHFNKNIIINFKKDDDIDISSNFEQTKCFRISWGESDVYHSFNGGVTWNLVSSNLKKTRYNGNYLENSRNFRITLKCDFLSFPSSHQQKNIAHICVRLIIRVLGIKFSNYKISWVWPAGIFITACLNIYIYIFLLHF